MVAAAGLGGAAVRVRPVRLVIVRCRMCDGPRRLDAEITIRSGDCDSSDRDRTMGAYLCNY